MKLSVATVFLEAERDRLIRLAAGDWDPRSTQPRDLPPGLNASRVPRAVNAHALIFPLRHAAPRRHISFPTDVIHATLDPFRVFEYSNIRLFGVQSGMDQRPVGLSTCNPLRSPRSTGILTCYPSVTPFGLALGPTNPTPIDVAWETLGIRRAGFSPA